MKRGLVWFKNDLRLEDNEALVTANLDCDELIYCYCIEDTNFIKSAYHFRKTDIVRFKFLEQSVRDLQKKLESLNGHLIIEYQSAILSLPRLIQQYNITDVYAEQEYAWEELNLIEDIKKILPNVNFNFFWGKTLHHINDIPFEISSIPLTSKAYRIACGQFTKPREVFPIPYNLKTSKDVKSIEFPSFKIYGFNEDEYENAQPLLDGGETAALQRLAYYTIESELLTGYRWSRNKSDGLDYSSKLSPYLALGCISPRLIYKKVKEYEEKIKKNQSTWWLVFELVWRDYFTFKAMRFGNKIYHKQGYKNKEIPWENDLVKFERWCNGTTGIPFIDAHMRQLNKTGYMSNRGRVNCASYFVHDLKIEWTWGASYFESKLIDYDVSSNWMNWHMQAFEIWYTNPVHQSNKYIAQDFIRKWIPELNDRNNIEVLIPWLYESIYIKPIEIYNKWGRSINLIQKNK